MDCITEALCTAPEHAFEDVIDAGKMISVLKQAFELLVRELGGDIRISFQVVEERASPAHVFIALR